MIGSHRAQDAALSRDGYHHLNPEWRHYAAEVLAGGGRAFAVMRDDADGDVHVAQRDRTGAVRASHTAAMDV
jgi:hypothetical protein